MLGDGPLPNLRMAALFMKLYLADENWFLLLAKVGESDKTVIGELWHINDCTRLFRFGLDL